MTRPPRDPDRPADEQLTTALPRPPAGSTPGSTPGGAPGEDAESAPSPVDYQETTILRRPPRPPAVSNVPGAGDRSAAPPPGAAAGTEAEVPPGPPGPAVPVPWPPPIAGRPPRSRPGANLPPYAGPALPDSGADDGDDSWGGYGTSTGDDPADSGSYDDGFGYEGGSGYEDGSGSDGRDAPAAGDAAGSARGRRRTPGEIPGGPGALPGGSQTRKGAPRRPRKLTVTRVAALRSRELTHRGLEKFHGAVSADGAGESGLGHLTYAVMGNYAVDAALAVALANTLFFAAAKAESTGKVLLYLLLTVAPFAIIAPLIGPALDRLQRGRRLALAASSVGRAALAVVMALNFDSWVIYPCALGMLVLSKGFGVLKAALTPRVLPRAITLVKTNSRLSVFGLIAGGISGGIAAGIAALTDSSGALWFTAACGLVGAWLCMRIPAWVESTAGELPIHHTGVIERPQPAARPSAGAHPGRDGDQAGESAGERASGRASSLEPDSAVRGLPRVVATALWANSIIRIETGFLALFAAFVIKVRYQPAPIVPTPGVSLGPATDEQGWAQLLLLAAVGAAAGLGGFAGNALGARLPLRAPNLVAIACLASVIVSVVVAFFLPGLVLTCVVAFAGSTASSLAKVCLDATIQDGLPEASRASAFGRSESVLQLSWVFGGVLGLLIGGVWTLRGDTVYRVGFGVVALLLLFGLAQAIAVHRGGSLLPEWRTLLRRRPGGRGSAGIAPGSQAIGVGAPAGRGAGTGPAAAPAPTIRDPRPGGKPRRRPRKAGGPR